MAACFDPPELRPDVLAGLGEALIARFPSPLAVVTSSRWALPYVVSVAQARGERFTPLVDPDRVAVGFITRAASDDWRLFGEAKPGDELPELVVNPERPGRYEPRVRKRRPKQYPLMTKPRSVLRKGLLDQGVNA